MCKNKQKTCIENSDNFLVASNCLCFYTTLQHSLLLLSVLWMSRISGSGVRYTSVQMLTQALCVIMYSLLFSFSITKWHTSLVELGWGYYMPSTILATLYT